MPSKSIREMNRFERRHYALGTRVFRSSILSSILLGVVALMIGLGLYAVALSGQYITEAFTITRSAQAILNEVVDVQPLAGEVMERYRGMSDAQRAQVYTDSYRARFSDLDSREDYTTARGILRDFFASSDVYDVYMAMYDRETSAMVYIADPMDDDEASLPGDWESVNEEGMIKFLEWNGEGKLYDVGKTELYGWLATCGMPIRNAAGEPVAFVLADVSLQNVTDGMKSFVLQYSLAMFLLVNLLSILTALRMKKKLAEPINRIAQAAQNYLDDKKNGVAAVEHFSKLNISTGDEIENLALIMADMESGLAEYETQLTKVTAEKERVGAELALATRIQADMLPNIYPAFPERREFDIFASMDPAKEVGGDFYDFFLVDDDHLAIVMADVSGKGVPAALFMMMTKIMLQNQAMTGKSPKDVLTAVNDQICRNNREEMFVTVWLGILELSTGKLSAANAGHEKPVLKTPDGAFGLVNDKHGFVIGGMEGVRYKEYELQLSPGSALFLYTDGVPEATRADNELFGTERMLSALNENKDAAPQQILEAMTKSVQAFVGDAPQFDDLTMLCLQFYGSGSDACAGNDMNA